MIEEKEMAGYFCKTIKKVRKQKVAELHTAVLTERDSGINRKLWGKDMRYKRKLWEVVGVQDGS